MERAFFKGTDLELVRKAEVFLGYKIN